MDDPPTPPVGQADCPDATAGTSATTADQNPWLARLQSLKELRSLQAQLQSQTTRLLGLEAAAEKRAAVQTALAREARLLHAERSKTLATLAAIGADLATLNDGPHGGAGAVSASSSTAGAARPRSGGVAAKAEEVEDDPAARRRFRADVVEPLKEQVDALRLKHGLGKLPALEGVVEAANARYLEERRQRWRETGVLGDPGDNGAAAGASGSSSGALHPSSISTSFKTKANSASPLSAQPKVPSNGTGSAKRRKTKR
ncbi:hypothetical protein HDU87_001345 [Geranomyces variabilis]|uniref:Uncharacterized protein n=1 Tax=Geranomyces variabilis TaxID=109894 RepID=A0AAD5TNG8_9FUNG|nr:hypothetical protein HDU87_001345 [Geranomyces variabilis]